MAARNEHTGFRIEPATAADAPVLLAMIKGLAEYERLSHVVVATEAKLRDSLFGAQPVAEAVIGRAGAEAAGYALYFPIYSTFLAQPGLYLEDLYVEPRWRGQGLGRRLLAHVAETAVARGCGRLDWSVLDWNEPALRFYRGLGAGPVGDWTVYRLAGAALARLGASGS